MFYAKDMSETNKMSKTEKDLRRIKYPKRIERLRGIKCLK